MKMKMMTMMLVLVYLINRLDASPVYLHGRSLKWFNPIRIFKPFKIPRVKPISPDLFPKLEPSFDYPTVTLPPIYRLPSGKPTVELPTISPHDPKAKPTPVNRPDRTTRLRARTCKIACKAVIDLAVAEVLAQTGAPADDSNSSCWAEIGKASVQQLCTDACDGAIDVRRALTKAGGKAFAACVKSRVAGADPPFAYAPAVAPSDADFP